MCEKNLDKSLEAVSSTNKCYEYPCLDYCCGRFETIVTSLHIPFYEVIDYEH